jgi:serine/threonine-protein kinase
LLEGQFRIERELGGGGMSQVFLAEETVLGRRVVLKVLPPEMAQVLTPERFAREVRVAAQLQHPHIVPLFAAGETGGLLYYTMPYVAGDSLRTRLARDGALPVPEAVRLLRDVASALAGAHAQGVVHRDIKPDNILISQGHGVVTDFGIAKAVSEAGQGASLTGTGMVVGTPAYMAPEQASADPRVDHRADLYALGVVAYEVLSGVPPFSGATAQAVIAAHVTRAPPPLSELRDSVPPALANLVMRLLAKQPADRPQSAADVVTALDAVATPAPAAPQAAIGRTWPLATVVALHVLASLAVLGLASLLDRLVGLPAWFLPGVAVLMAIGLPIVVTTAVHHNDHLAGAPRSPLTWRRALGGGVAAVGGLGLLAAVWIALRSLGIGPVGTLIAKGRLAEREPILVAEFVDRTRDSLLGRMVTEALRVDLAGSKSLSVVSPDYVKQILRLMSRPPSSVVDAELAREVAQRGGIKAVLTGEVQQAGTGYLIVAQLVAPDSGVVLAAVRASARDADQFLAAVDKVSKAIRERVGESLRALDESPALDQVTTSSLSALRRYSEAVRASDRGDDAEGIALLEQAVGLDSTFAMAWRKLGTLLGNNRVDRAREHQAITRAYSLRDRLTAREAVLTTASYHTSVTGQTDSAMEALRAHLRDYPSDPWALNNLGVSLFRIGEPEAAAGYYRRSLAVEPLNSLALTNVIWAALAAGWADTARAARAQFLAEFPGHSDRAFWDIVPRLALREYDAAEPLIREQRERATGDLRARAVWTRLLAGLTMVRGRFGEADRLFREEEALWQQLGSPTSAIEAAARRTLMTGKLRADPVSAARILDDARRRYPGIDSASAAVPWPLLTFGAAAADRNDVAGRFLGTAWRVSRTPPERMVAASGATELALAGGISMDAVLDTLRMILPRSPCKPCTQNDLARLADARGQSDSAIAGYLALTESLEPWWLAGISRPDLAPAYLRLGELYEQAGNRDRAIEFYRRFADLYVNADAEAQPKVRHAKARIVALAAEP